MSTTSHSKAQHKGFATLESAMIVTVLTAVCIGVIALIDYLNRTDSAYASLDRQIHNSSVKPFVIEQNNDGQFKLQIDSAALRAFIDKLVTSASGTSAEAGYSMADIDPSSGALLGIRPLEYRTSRGPNRPRPTDICGGLETELIALSQAGSAHEGPSILALPDAGSSQQKYFPQTIIVAARTELDFSEAPLTGKAISLIGINPRVTICSAAVMRGEVSSGEKGL